MARRRRKSVWAGSGLGAWWLLVGKRKWGEGFRGVFVGRRRGWCGGVVGGGWAREWDGG